MKLIDETDGDVDGDVDESSASRSTTRRSLGTRDPDWQHFYQKARDGNVKATVVIDFEYEFNNTVERMYCFEDGDTSRVVIHVHTLEVWPGYATANDPATDPTTRARKVTAVNLRRAERLQSCKPGQASKILWQKFWMNPRGCSVVGVPKWKRLVQEGKGGDIQWSWGLGGDVPPEESRLHLIRQEKWRPPLTMEADVKVAYDEVRSVPKPLSAGLSPISSNLIRQRVLVGS